MATFLTDSDLEPKSPVRLVDYQPLTQYDRLIPLIEAKVGLDDPLIVVLDFGQKSWPYREDQHRLVEAMEAAWPKRDISFRIFNEGPGDWTDYREEQSTFEFVAPQAWVRPRPHIKIIIVSDLDRLSGNSFRAEAWKNFIGDAIDHRSKVALLTPDAVAVSLLLKENIIPWNETVEYPMVSGYHPGLDDLLAMAAPLRRIDPPLLRELRRALPVYGSNDPALEGLFWNCPHVIGVTVVDIKKDCRELHLKRFRSLPAATQLAVFQLQRKHHAHLSAALHHEEVLSFAAHAGAGILADPEVASEVQAAEEWLERLFATLCDYMRDVRKYKEVSIAITARADKTMKEKYPCLR